MLNWSEEELKLKKQQIIDGLKRTEEKVTPVLIDKNWNRFLFNLEVAKNLEKLRRMKIEAAYRSVDVTDTKKVRDAIKDVENHFNSSITHIIHGAGLEESKSFKKKKREFSNLIVSVKVQGIWNILNSIEIEKLKRVVCFTSIAGRYGNRGQVDYSFANGYLARLCWKLNQQGISSIAADWSAWAGVGMATRGSIMDILTSQGINPIPLASGIETFVKLFLNSIGGELIVSCGLGPFEELSRVESKIANKKYPMINSLNYSYSKFQLKKTVSTAEDLYLNDHQIQETPVFPGVMGIEMFAEAIDILQKNKPSILTDIEFNTALKISSDKSKDIFVEFRPEQDELLLKSEFVAKIDPSKKREIEHFKAKFERSAGKRRAKVSSSIIQETDIILLTREEIYSFFFHGKSFQVLESLVELKDNNAICSVSIPEEDLFAKPGMKTILNPLAIEAALQTAGLYDYIVNGKVSLPSMIDSLTIFNSRKPTHIVSSFKEMNSTHSKFDVEVLDKDGKLIILLEGLGLIHTQISFNEDSNLKNKILQTLKYWKISKSLGQENFKIIPISVISTQLKSKDQKILSLLTKYEKDRFNKIKNEKRRIEYIAGIIAAKELYLSIQKGDSKNKDVEIRKEEKGKPFFFDLKTKSDANVHLSITHSGEFAIAAVDESPIGIDIEQIEERSEAFYKEAFTDKERDSISANAEKGTIYWTIKEAITKALGEGLHLNLHDIEISEDKDKSSYSIGFSSNIKDSLPYDPDSFEIMNKRFQNYTISYCQIKKEERK